MNELLQVDPNQESLVYFESIKSNYFEILTRQYANANHKEYKTATEALVASINEQLQKNQTKEQQTKIYRATEKAIFAAELAFMEIEDRDIALAPRMQLEMLKHVESITSSVEDQNKAGGIMTLVGPPGTGKTEFALATARRLHFANGVVQFDVNPGARLADQFADPGQKSTNGAEGMLSLLQEISVHDENDFQATWGVIVTKYIWSQEASPQQLINAFTQFLSSIGIEETPSLELKEILEINYKSSEKFAKLILEKTKDPRDLIQKLISFFAQERVKEISSSNILKGIVYEAMRRGLVLIVNELEKEAIAALLPGFGAEGMLRTEYGKTFTLNGVSVEIAKGFLVIATANDADAIPAHTQSRLPMKHEDVKASDFFFQARLLLTNEDDSYLFENDTDTDSKLTYFLLWFNQITRFQAAGFRTNLLAQLISSLKRTKDFDEAIEETLPNDLITLYHQYELLPNEMVPLSLLDFSLMAFNEVVSSEKVRSPKLEALQIGFDENTKTISLTATDTNTERNPQAINKGINLDTEVFSENTTTETSPLFQTTALISDSKKKLAFFDLPSGKMMAAKVGYAEDKTTYKNEFSIPNVQTILKVHFATDTTGFILGVGEANNLILNAFTINNAPKKGQETSQPTVTLFAQKNISKNVPNTGDIQNIEISQNGNVFSLNGEPFFTYDHTSRFAKLFKDVG